MAKYQVYGIGNALVDLEYEVGDDDLGTLGIDKGVMTLVDAGQQQAIMHHLHAHTPRRGSGGSAANSLIALCQLGGSAFYSCKVANDELGTFYMHDLNIGGVATADEAQRAAGDTGRCLVLVTPDSDRTMCTYLGISDGLSRTELNAAALRDSDWYYMEGYLVTSPEARAAVVAGRDIATAAGVKTALSLSDPNMVKFFRDGLLEMIGPGVDLIFANELEAMGMAGSDDLAAAAEHLKTLARTFVITRGPRGSLIWDGITYHEIDAVPVKAVDTVGAGDSFAGAFLYAIDAGWSYQRAGALASALSSRLVSSFGPRLPADETRAVLAQFR